MARSLVCWNCGAALEDDPRIRISRHDSCQNCFADLHCCRMCRFYDTDRPGDCDHERAEPPVEKLTSNFCDFFSQRYDAFANAEGEAKSNARSQADALFAGPGADAEQTSPEQPAGRGSDEDKARSRLDDLFK